MRNIRQTSVTTQRLVEHISMVKHIRDNRGGSDGRDIFYWVRLRTLHNVNDSTVTVCAPPHLNIFVFYAIRVREDCFSVCVGAPWREFSYKSRVFAGSTGGGRQQQRRQDEGPPSCVLLHLRQNVRHALHRDSRAAVPREMAAGEPEATATTAALRAKQASDT
jgi:hypothetical protein